MKPSSQEESSFNNDEAQQPLLTSPSIGQFSIRDGAVDNPTPVTLEGVLYKRRDVFQMQWRPRYFVLNTNQSFIQYYVFQDGHHDKQHLRGTIYLSNKCQVYENHELSKMLQDQQQNSSYTYVFSITAIVQNNQSQTTHHHHLAARTQEERLRWVKALTDCCTAAAREIVKHSNSVAETDDGSVNVDRSLRTITITTPNEPPRTNINSSHPSSSSIGGGSSCSKQPTGSNINSFCIPPPIRKTGTLLFLLLVVLSLFSSCCVFCHLGQFYFPGLRPSFKISICVCWVALVLRLAFQGKREISNENIIANESPLSIPILTYASALLPLVFLIPVTAISSSNHYLRAFSYLTTTVIAWLYIRLLVKSVLGTPLRLALNHYKSQFLSLQNPVTGIITCKMQVDIKGAVRFINQKKESHIATTASTTPPRRTTKDSLNGVGDDDVSLLSHENAPVTITHIVMKAVAKALYDNPELNTRRVRIPWLAIDDLYPTRGVAVVAPSFSGAIFTDSCIVLEDAERLTVQEISSRVAAAASAAEERKKGIQASRSVSFDLYWQLLSQKLGILSVDVPEDGQPRSVSGCSALVITSPNSNRYSDVEISVAPFASPYRTCKPTPKIIVTVGGVRLVRDVLSDESHTSISISVSMDCETAGVATCRRFCEQLKNLVLIPELCDSSND